MGTEDTLSSPPLPSKKDEKETQKALDHLHKNGTLKATHKWTGFQDKTLWDWLQLLATIAIPLVLGGATLLFSIQQANLAQQQHENDQKIANQQREADKQSALDQQEATILQTYIDNIQDLLLNRNLLKSKSTDDVAILARARTLTALQGLDPHRKGVLLNFLYEARLIGFIDLSSGKKGDLVFSLFKADLTNADLTNADFSGANLSGANLTNAFLLSTHLDRANLDSAYLEGAHLDSAFLTKADLIGANLTDADLTGAFFSGANLNSAYLTNADLSGVHLDGANLDSAYLEGAHLDRADLGTANLRETNITQQQLDQVYTCMGALLPEGLTCHKNH